MKLLVLSGGNHPYKETTPILESFLKDAGYSLTVSEDASLLSGKDMENYDALVFNTLRYGDLALNEKEQEGLINFVSEGKGFVCIHVSGQRPENWDEYQEITGGGWITKVCKHSPYGQFEVTVWDETHPCSKDLEKFIANDELYYECPDKPKQLGWWDGNEVFLATEWLGLPRPMAWTRKYGNGLVMQTLLGHDGLSFSNPAFQQIIINGIEYVTGRIKIN
ncbi:MAG: ThuA domain-containing protein [SAR202 cluster bacterium]|jgi:type 1 glutamine amidotransferase|nr:ThuA domain-containing protein [SAR202 cluster bacterium]|tara:strand:+ start:3165 stop:3827 length:663 start_codon:yes stop_codon:yes gene_type:complete